MNWENFKNKFHITWHPYVKSFIESEKCDNIYTFLKNQRGVEIAPKSIYTFRTFKQSLDNVKIVVFIDKPYSDEIKNIHYADGIPLSCEFIDKIHPKLDRFYHAMEEEFYGFNLNIIKSSDLNFYINQGVLFLSDNLTVEINTPESHKNLWTPFTEHLIKTIFNPKNIPFIICGEDLYKKYKDILSVQTFITDSIKPYNWKANGEFLKANQYLFKNTPYEEIMWVKLDCPF